MSRTNAMLGGLLVAQILLFGSVYLFGQRAPASNLSGPVAVMQGIRLSAVERLRIEKHAGGAIELALGPASSADGEKTWTLPQHADYPADKDKVSSMVSRLLGLEANHLISKSAEHHTKLEVAKEDFRRKVTLETANDKRVLFVGGRSAGFTNVRLEPRDEVLAIDDLNEWDLGSELRDWIKPEYFQLDRDRLAAVEIRRGAQQLRIERSHLKEWRIDDQPGDVDKTESLIDQAVRIEPVGVVGRLSDPKVLGRLESGEELLVVTLSLAKDPLPVSPTTPAGVAGPGEQPTGEEGADGRTPNAGGPKAEAKAEQSAQRASRQASDEHKRAAPQIAERKVVHIVKHPDEKSRIMLWAQGATHAVEVDRWRVEKLLEAKSESLRK